MAEGDHPSHRGDVSAGAMRARRRLLLAALAATLFVVYGSLLPFQFEVPGPNNPQSNGFTLPWLAIGVAGRSDWIANGILFAVVALLWVAALDCSGASVRRVLVAAAVLGALAPLALAIEYAQRYFPPRTVSANDLLAEIVGAALGVAAAWFMGARIRRVLAALSEPGIGGASVATGRVDDEARDHRVRAPTDLRVAFVRATLLTYAVFYICTALFPFDFLLVPREFAEKDFAAQAGWLVAPRSCASSARCTIQLVADALLALPLGLALAMRRGRTALGFLVAAGLVWGVAIEGLQLLLASGVSQGLSIVAKALGVVAGGFIAGRTADVVRWLTGARGRQALWFALPVYLGALVLLVGGGAPATLDASAAWARLATVSPLPFFHYYYTSETRALASVLVQIVAFAPLGLFVVLALPSLGRRSGMFAAGWAAAAVAGTLQAIRLFRPPLRADPTDVLLAIAAAVVSYRIARVLLGRTAPDRVAPAVQGPPPTVGAPRPPPQPVRQPADALPVSVPEPVPASLAARALALATVALLGWSVFDYPLNRTLLAAALLAYAVLLAYRPHAWIAALPALLPIASLAGWSGRLYVSEFDRFVLVTVATVLWRGLPPRQAAQPPHFPRWLMVLLGLSMLGSVARGLLPLDTIDANAFATYTGHYNALRIAKGLVIAALLCWLARRTALSEVMLRRWFGWGLATSVAGVVAVVVWERFVFTGLFNFAHEYRVTGPFWEMNTGGAYIEGFLVATLPFVVYWLTAQHGTLWRALGLAVLTGGIYAVLVTMSRNGLVAWAAALLVLVAGFLAHSWRRRAAAPRALAGVAALLLLTLAVSVPVLTGATLKARFGTVKEDLRTRVDHWERALALRGDTWTDAWFGKGLGRFPESYFWDSVGTRRASTYRFLSENGKPFLRLGAGESLYLDQFVDTDPESTYVLTLAVRSSAPEASLAVPLCEKWLLDSLQCVWHNLLLPVVSSGFQLHTIRFDSGRLARGSLLTRRPVRLTLLHASDRGAIDVADVHLVGSDGRDVLANGSFARGMDNWHFSTDSHLPWHIKNMALQILFDQGWIGALLWAAVVAYAGSRTLRNLWRGDLFAACALAGLVGFLVVGIFDSLIDTPRLFTLFGMLLWLAAARPARTTPA